MQGPRCSIRSKNMYSDLTVDYLKLTLLNVPAVLLVRRTSLRLPSYDSASANELLRIFSAPSRTLEPTVVLWLGCSRGSLGRHSSVGDHLCCAMRQVLGALFSIDDITGFEITKVHSTPQMMC